MRCPWIKVKIFNQSALVMVCKQNKFEEIKDVVGS